MFYNLIDLDKEFSSMAQNSVGFTGADLNMTNSTLQHVVEGGSAIDFIESVAVVSPDVLRQGWLTQMYSEHSWIAFDLFKLLLLASILGYILKQVGAEFGENEASMIHLLKRSIVSTFMIAEGLPIIMLLLLVNQELTFMIAPGHVATDLMVAGITSPFGAVMVIAYTIGIFAEGFFYLVRFHLIYISCIVWVYAWLMWTFAQTARHGVFLIIIIMINIFLGFAIATIWRIGAACINNSSVPVVGWGGDIAGLGIMAIALFTPVWVFFYVIWNPTPAIQKITYIAAKGV